MSSKPLILRPPPVFVGVLGAGSKGRELAGAVISYILSTCLLFAIMAVFRHLPLANEATAGLVFLLAVLLTAALSGYATSLSVAVTATLLYDYFFIPPVNTWDVGDYRDWVTLGVFLLTAVVGSTLSFVARRETQRAKRQRREAEQLYDMN
jgi:two-component system sensor histidine kinase KdpD